MNSRWGACFVLRRGPLLMCNWKKLAVVNKLGRMTVRLNCRVRWCRVSGLWVPYLRRGCSYLIRRDLIRRLVVTCNRCSGRRLNRLVVTAPTARNRRIRVVRCWCGRIAWYRLIRFTKLKVWCVLPRLVVRLTVVNFRKKFVTKSFWLMSRLVVTKLRIR